MVYLANNLFDLFKIFTDNLPLPQRVIFKDYSVVILFFNDGAPTPTDPPEYQGNPRMSIGVRILNRHNEKLCVGELHANSDGSNLVLTCEPTFDIPEKERTFLEMEKIFVNDMDASLILKFYLETEAVIIDRLQEWDSLLNDYQENR